MRMAKWTPWSRWTWRARWSGNGGSLIHVVQDVDPAKPNYVGAGKTVADHPGRINLNLPGKPLKRDWLHCKLRGLQPRSPATSSSTPSRASYM